MVNTACLGIAPKRHLIERRVAALAAGADLDERRLQLGQRLEGGVGARVLVVVEHELAVEIAHRDEALLLKAPPAASPAIRAGQAPCSPACDTHPITTSSTCFGSKPLRSLSAFRHCASNS